MTLFVIQLPSVVCYNKYINIKLTQIRSNDWFYFISVSMTELLLPNGSSNIECLMGECCYIVGGVRFGGLLT